MKPEERPQMRRDGHSTLAGVDRLVRVVADDRVGDVIITVITTYKYKA